MWIAHDGKKHQSSSNSMNSFNEGSQMDISFSLNTLKVSTKKYACNFSITKNKEFNVFFAIQGKAKLEVVYPAN